MLTKDKRNILSQFKGFVELLLERKATQRKFPASSTEILDSLKSKNKSKSDGIGRS